FESVYFKGPYLPTETACYGSYRGLSNNVQINHIESFRKPKVITNCSHCVPRDYGIDVASGLYFNWIFHARSEPFGQYMLAQWHSFVELWNVKRGNFLQIDREGTLIGNCYAPCSPNIQQGVRLRIDYGVAIGIFDGYSLGILLQVACPVHQANG